MNITPEIVKEVTRRIVDILHCCDVEAQNIANRISGPLGKPNQCPDGVQVLEDAESILIKASELVCDDLNDTAAL